MTDWCSTVSKRIGPALDELGLVKVGSLSFGESMRREDVCYFEVGRHLIAITNHAHSGLSCFIGQVGSDRASYNDWPSLWKLVFVDFDHYSLEEIVALFPKEDGEMFELVATKLNEFLSEA